jgi:hypothetical protein
MPNAKYNTAAATTQYSAEIPADQKEQTENPAKESCEFQFSVLTCASHKIATKIIYADGRVIGYDKLRYFHYKYCEIDSLDDFAKLALEWLATQPNRFIIRGQLKPGLSGWQRRLWHDDVKSGDPATIECPPRRWIVLDVDAARVPAGLAAPDKVAEAGYHIRDNLLPPYFRGVRCVAAATPSSGRKGPCTAHLRLFFVLKEAADNEALRLWSVGLSEKFKAIDPTVMRPMQPIYTARPIFRGCSDPVPSWGRVRILDGFEEEVASELPRGFRARKHDGERYHPPAPHVCSDMPDWMLECAERDEGLGVAPIEEISDKAWTAIRLIFESLDGCPKNGKGRHDTLNTGAWWLARLVAECELPEDKARAAYFKAAEGINNSDGKYDAALIARHIDDAFVDIGRRAP